MQVTDATAFVGSSVPVGLAEDLAQTIWRRR
jgi:hypothetical protein